MKSDFKNEIVKVQFGFLNRQFLTYLIRPYRSDGIDSRDFVTQRTDAMFPIEEPRSQMPERHRTVVVPRNFGLFLGLYEPVRSHELETGLDGVVVHGLRIGPVVEVKVYGQGDGVLLPHVICGRGGR